METSERVSDVRKSATGVLLVAAISVGVWWLRIPGLTSFVMIPPLLLGIGVGVVTRCSAAPPIALVVTALVTTAILFGIVVARWSAYGVHGEALGNVIGMGALVVVEAAFAAGAGAFVGRRGRDRANRARPHVGGHALSSGERAD